MNHIISKLLIYAPDEGSVLAELSKIFKDYEDGTAGKDSLITRTYAQIRRILKIATDFGFDKNLWQNYLTFLLITNENPFSITCEKTGAKDGSVNDFAISDCSAFKELFDYDFSQFEKSLKIDCFFKITNYKAIVKKELMYNKSVSEKVLSLSESLSKTANGREFFVKLTDFYKAYGVGMFGLNKAFRIKSRARSVFFLPRVRRT